MSLNKTSDKQRKWDYRWLRMATEVSTWSKDPSTKCGAIIVNDRNRIVSTGYNGFPSAISDTTKRLEDRDTKYKYTIHAELNALHEATCDIRGNTLYVWPLNACHTCALHVIQRGIVRVVTVESSDDMKTRWAESNQTAAEMFAEAGVTLITYPSV